MSRELARRQIEAAVSLIAQNFDELRLVFEDGGSDVTAEDLRKVMVFLRNELDETERKIAELLRTARVAKAPTFSLDAPAAAPMAAAIPVASAQTPKEPPEIAARRQRIELAQKLGGRLSNFAPEVDPDAERAPVYPPSGSEYVGAGVGFLDDKNENSDIDTL